MSGPLVGCKPGQQALPTWLQSPSDISLLFPRVSFATSRVSFAVAVLQGSRAGSGHCTPAFPAAAEFPDMPCPLAVCCWPHHTSFLAGPTPLANKCLVTPQSCGWRGWGGNAQTCCRQLGFGKRRAAPHLSAPAPQQHRSPPPKITNVVAHKQSIK